MNNLSNCNFIQNNIICLAWKIVWKKSSAIRHLISYAMGHNSELKNKIAHILVKILLTMQNVFETFHYFLSFE